MDRVAIIILNWNGVADTLECLASLQNQSHKNFMIVAVDNGSTDNSRQLLDEYKNQHSKNTRVIHNPKNFGFAGGVNTGIEFAMNGDFDYIALFNNDAVADKNWLKSLINAIKPDSVGISTGLLLLNDGKKIDTTGEQYTTWGLPFPRGRGYTKNKTYQAEMVFGATGGASLYKTQMLREIGLFDEDFFAYYEDTDVSFRAQLMGWKVAYTPDAVAYHKQGETSKKMPGFAVYQTFKNLPLLFIKNVPRGLLITTGIRFYFAYILMFLNAVKNGSGKQASRGAWKSFILGFKKLGERWQIQKNRQVTTKYIKSMLWKDLPPDQTGLRKLRKFFTGKV
jgi:GT2 family glycosyltransferase